MIESTFKEDISSVVLQEEHLGSGSSHRIKPRALIFKANEKDLDEIKELIKTRFPNVEIVYITTGPPASILRVTKSMPLETENDQPQSLYSNE